MLPLLLMLTIVLAGETGWVAIAALSLSVFLALVRAWDWWKKSRPVVTLITEIVPNDYHPENDLQTCNVLYIHMSLVDDLTVFSVGSPKLLDDKGKELRKL